MTQPISLRKKHVRKHGLGARLTSEELAAQVAEFESRGGKTEHVEIGKGRVRYEAPVDKNSLQVLERL